MNGRTGSRHLRGLMLAMLLAAGTTPAMAAQTAQARDGQHEREESRADWHLLGVALAGLVIGRLFVMRRSRPDSRPRR